MASKRVRELAGRQRWDEAQARRALQVWKESGLSGAKFAAKHGLNAQRLFWWRKRLEEDVVQQPRVRLIPADVVGLAEAAHPKAVVIRIAGGVAIEVDSDAVSPSWVAALVRELAEA